MFELVASGGIVDVWKFSQYEDLLPEGERGLVELDLTMPVPEFLAQELEDQLRQAGVEDVSVTTASPLLRIYFRKGFPWLAVIAAAILGLIILAVLIVGWRIFKEVVPEELQPLIGGLGLIVLLALGAVILTKAPWGFRQ